ncbi:S41 family peptidase [Hymenobacter convexus]|uniref:S41 family peptidase n=1 Tax=Hymenobacter sp. CA1UV-4 TaxID=3063782 RepID=UPI0027125407|nr:S41 family peptidase [Hymenobacter sp. CA1UV-4]MDO7850620.1 S41 family peptidase [Hymenobacter sp. CA1UV-4]
MKRWRFRFGLGVLVLLMAAGLAAQTPPLTHEQYLEDFDFFWETVRDHYGYFNQKQTDWPRVRTIYRAQADTVRSRRAFVRLLENALAELYDNHASLNTNRPDSRRLVPTGTDVWATFVNGQAVVQQVRAGYGAEKVGVKPGAVIEAVNGVPVAEALRPLLAQTLHRPDPAARNFALGQLLAGDHRTPRTWTMRLGTRTFTAQPDVPVSLLETTPYRGLLAAKRLGDKGTIGYIKLNNSLGDNRLIAKFDSALTALKGTERLILDLRETPSGGNTTVARAIMGRFIEKEMPYQRHELPNEEAETGIPRRWLELVAPRGPRYPKPVVVLEGRWTGSMGEGLAIGFDALHRATLVGTEMAQLRGAIYSYKLPHSGIGFSFPVERLYHINGRPRENYQPPFTVDLVKAAQQPKPSPDPVMKQALSILEHKN